MKKLLFVLMILSLGNAKAQRYNSVDPCRSPDVRAFVVNDINENWISSGPANSAGGLFCGAVIATGAAATSDFLHCISSVPVTPITNAARAPGSTSAVTIAFADSRLLFPVLVATVSQVATLSPMNGFFQPVRFTNLMCQITAAATPAVVYINTAVK